MGLGVQRDRPQTVRLTHRRPWAAIHNPRRRGGTKSRAHDMEGGRTMVARNTPSKSSLARCVSAPAAGSEEAARLLEVLLLPALEHLRGEGARGVG